MRRFENRSARYPTRLPSPDASSNIETLSASAATKTSTSSFSDESLSPPRPDNFGQELRDGAIPIPFAPPALDGFRSAESASAPRNSLMRTNNEPSSPEEFSSRTNGASGFRSRPRVVETTSTTEAAPLNTLSLEHPRRVRMLTNLRGDSWWRSARTRSSAYDSYCQPTHENRTHNYLADDIDDVTDTMSRRLSPMLGSLGIERHGVSGATRFHPLHRTAPRHSVPSTHILYGKNKHRGGANVVEQEAVTEMLRRRAAHVSPGSAAIAADDLDDLPDIRMKLSVKVHGPERNGQLANPVDVIEKYLQRALAKVYKWNLEGHLPRAPYENQRSVFEIHVELQTIAGVKYERERIGEFVETFCDASKELLGEQIFLEIPALTSIFSTISSHHSGVAVCAIALGNSPVPGVFFVRGDYISRKNAICNSRLQPTNSDASRENVAFKVAGAHEYLSFARFEHDRRILIVYFGVPLPLQSHRSDGLQYAGYRLTVPYSSFSQVIVDMKNPELHVLYFHLKHPPQLSEANPRSALSHPSKARVINLETCTDWTRVLQWCTDEEQRSLGCSQEALAQSSWLRVDFKPCQGQKEVFLDVVSRLARRSTAKIVFGAVAATRRPLSPAVPMNSVGSFRADYAITALMSRGSVVLDQLFDHRMDGSPLPIIQEHIFFQAIRKAMKECSRACEESLEQLVNALDERRSVDVLKAFFYIYSSKKAAYERVLAGERMRDVGLLKPLPKNCVYVPKVMVCPTRTLLMAPEAMLMNRVVRKFGPDYALRCVFRDDNGGRLLLRDFVQDKTEQSDEPSAISDLIYATLKSGVRIVDRVYHFLAWSNSQLRDQGCYLFAARKDATSGELRGTIAEIRAWMGDFSTATSVPKMMSRMGQCFTQAQPTFKLKKNQWTVEEDFVGGETGNFVFSDGCGRISFKLAYKIALKLELPTVPSCFQVRFKGFKGILVIDPLIDNTVNMPKVVFRKSQQKFLMTDESVDDYLEVVKYAMPSPVCLNRPMITILDQVSEKQSPESHRRISLRVHFYLERELSLLSAMLVNERRAASELTSRLNLPIDFGVVSRSGFLLTADSFLRRLLVAVYRYNILHHISKAKIFLPSHLGRSMYGVVDESGVLMPGQVFIQYSPSLKKASLKPVLIRGKVLITKNPCHVAGDVRVFEAVHQPTLEHLVDVVVFPQFGRRPHPDEMAGSDLDGDEYAVIWDPNMLFDANEEAMVFPNQSAAEEDNSLTTDDMVEFFIRYLKQDSIGRVSNAHLISADLRGLFHDLSNSIALKCSVAVDFPKSGVAAKKLTIEEQCDVAPDYMPTSNRPMYSSVHLNGQLFRKARKVEEILEEYERKGSVYEGHHDRLVCPDDVDVFFGDQKALLAAQCVHADYASRIQQLLDEYGIEDEASVVSGHAAVIKRLAGMEKCNRQDQQATDDYSFYHTDKVVELRYEKIFSSFRKRFFDEFGGEERFTVTEGQKTTVTVTPAMHERVRQWYFVAYVSPQKRASGGVLPGQSLPWVVWDVLSDLRTKLVLEKEAVTSFVSGPKYPIAERLEEQIGERIAARADEFDAFRARIDDLPHLHFIAKYAFAYGDQLYELLFVLEEWLLETKVLPSAEIDVEHVSRLLIQFALGILHKGVGGLVSVEPNVVFCRILSNEGPDEKFSENFDAATLLIEFLEYLGSQGFAGVNCMSLRVFQEGAHFEPILMRPAQWIPLHHMAYRTFHAIAISGRFDALHLDVGSFDEFVSESKDPVMVRSTLFDSSRNYSVTPIAQHAIIDALKRWSGVREVFVRNVERKSDVVYISCLGSVLARQRLARLLLLGAESIHDAVSGDVVPDEVRDDFV